MLLSSKMVELGETDSSIASGTLENPRKHKTMIKAKTRENFLICILRVVVKGIYKRICKKTWEQNT